ncbi:MAG TPA: endo alpha-1,4 polygalactosaminidase, partial [Polyangiales bacterium]|nr:endo alpha-1,4 polygalactosaminidase [Polyangiales bacterium]
MGGGSSGTGGTGGGGGTGGSHDSDSGIATDWYRPAVGSSWHIQYAGQLDTTVDALNYDIDLYDTPVETIDALHAKGRKVICYF